MTTQTETIPQNGDYRVDLEVFSGPLDLLLHLIRKEEVEICDIPLARITNQYLRYIDLMKTLNLEVAGDFILMAATLIRIKARLLLPRSDEDGDEPDPREELIMALVEYRKYKEGGDILRDCALEEERVYVPVSPVKQVEGRIDFEPVTNLYDLIMAFRTVMSERREEITHDVNSEEISIEERMYVVLELLRERDGATFVELFADVPRKIIAIVTFIALLELARTGRIRIQQVKPFTEMRVYRGDKYEAPPQDVDVVELTTARELT